MNYNNTIEKTVVFIENHLAASFTAEDTARETGYSYYHLNRQFSAILGENVGSCIKKRRLSHAARELIYTERYVIGIALDYGFESGKAFSRAFKAVCHTGPAYYRKSRLDVIISQRPRADQHLLAHLIDPLTVRPRIVEIPNILTAGLRNRTILSPSPGVQDHFRRKVYRVHPHRLPKEPTTDLSVHLGHLVPYHPGKVRRQRGV